MGNATKRHTYPIPVIFHSRPVTSACQKLISRTRPIAEQAVAPAGKMDYLFWTLSRITEFLIDHGEAQIRSGRYRLALACYSLALKLTPDDVETWSRSFMVRMARRDFSRALKDICVALSLSPRDLNLVVQHAEVSQALEMWTAAVADYDALLRARPDRADLRAKQAGMYAAWGDCLIRDARPDLALECYATALQITPDNISILARRANVKIGLGDCSGALSDVDKALTLVPEEANLIAQRVVLMDALEQQNVGGAH
jgi:tetratricopeptide (TPR) repeat protein